MCFTVLTMPHWSSSEQLPVVLRDKRDVTLIYKKEICLYISVTSGDQLICSIPLGYHWFYKLTYPLFKTNSGFSKLKRIAILLKTKILVVSMPLKFFSYANYIWKLLYNRFIYIIMWWWFVISHTPWRKTAYRRFVSKTKINNNKFSLSITYST